jgi:heme-degrading monooxygenase HmoA
LVLTDRTVSETVCLNPAPRGKLNFMHIIIWKFTVREEHIQEFISAYESNGDWANLFRRAEGYLGTQLLRSTGEPSIFLTIDRWENATCFEVFQDRFRAEYKTLDTQFEGYSSSERKVGVFSEASLQDLVKTNDT